MATDQKYIDFIVDQIHHPAGITYKRMFGEYGLYAGGQNICLNMRQPVIERQIIRRSLLLEILAGKLICDEFVRDIKVIID